LNVSSAVLSMQWENGMKFSRYAVLLFLSAATVATIAPVWAKKEPKQDQQAGPKKPTVSKEALKDLQALDTAVKAKEAASIPGLVAAAKVSAKTPDDRFVLGQLSLAAAIEAKDSKAMLDALQTIVDSGFVAPADMFEYHINIGRLQYDSQNFPAAVAALEKALQLNPNSVEALAASSDSYNQLKRYPESLAAVRKAIRIRAASGLKVEESWYRRAASVAINNGLPESIEASLEWVKAYPSTASWSDALRNLQLVRQMDPSAAIDVSRLLNAVGALRTENEYYRYASAASTKGLPGEAKEVLEAGFASGKIKRTSAALGPLYASVSAKAKGDRESLAAAAKTALAAPAPRQAVIIGDAYYGYGDYAQAISLYRAALNKAGVDKDLVNLHLGMALARSGDKAGAKEALAAVGGAQAEVAKFWLAYVDTLS
jgi:tetratricopeptide (TPR) repeat protein